jgi:hypothetical protein
MPFSQLFADRTWCGYRHLGAFFGAVGKSGDNESITV